MTGSSIRIRLLSGLALAALAFGAVSNLLGQRTASLRTRQTVVVVRAGRDAPSLVSLRSGEFTPWKNAEPETLIDSVEVEGRRLPVRWKWVRGESHTGSQTVSFVYRSSAPALRLTWEWRVRDESGPLEHTIRIENLDTSEVWIPLQDSFRFRFGAPAHQGLRHTYIDKARSKPSVLGTHQPAISEGYRWEGRSSTYAKDEDEREILPWSMVEREGPGGDGWYVGIEFSGRTRLTLERDAGSLTGSVGLNPNPGPFRSRLRPNEVFETPTVMVGGFSGGADGLGNVLRPWIRRVLGNPATWSNPDYPTLVNNSWGSGMQVDEALAGRMLADSAELGLEMLHIDAGWFRGVGDWYPSGSKFPHGLAALAGQAHARGLKFGIWVNWAQAGVDTGPTALNAHDPKTRDWLVADAPPGWKPDEFVGRTIDIGEPAAKEYAQREVERLVTDYHLDMLEHDGYLVAKNCSRTDHLHAAAAPAQMSPVPGSGIGMPDNSNSTDVSYRAVRAYYDIYAEERRRHPGLLFEICNDGGRMVDFGSAAHGDYFSISDAYDPLSNRQAFYDASHVLPAAMLEDYAQKWPTPRIENFRSMLRSGMMGWLTIMQDTNAWTAGEHAAAKAEFALYKSVLRPLIRDADLYHVSERPDGVRWDGLEYFNPKSGRGVLYAFRGSAPGEAEHVFPLKGLRPGELYRIRFQDGSLPDRTVNGAELLRNGLRVALSVPESSELVFLEEIGEAEHNPSLPIDMRDVARVKPNSLGLRIIAN